jgi:hypothetical protein
LLIEMRSLWWYLGSSCALEVRWAGVKWCVRCGCLRCAGSYLPSVQNINLACLPSHASHGCVMIIMMGVFLLGCHL